MISSMFCTLGSFAIYVAKKEPIWVIVCWSLIAAIGVAPLLIVFVVDHAHHWRGLMSGARREYRLSDGTV